MKILDSVAEDQRKKERPKRKKKKQERRSRLMKKESKIGLSREDASC